MDVARRRRSELDQRGTNAAAVGGKVRRPSGQTSPNPVTPLSIVSLTTVLGRASITLPPDVTYRPWTYVRSYP